MTDHIFKRLVQQGSATQLGCVRIVFGLYILWLLAVPGNLQVLDILDPEPFEKVHFFMLPDAISDMMIEYNAMIIKVGIASAALMVFGLFTATSTGITAFCFIATHYTLFKLTYYHNEWPYLWLPLVVLAISRCGDKLSMDAWLYGRRKKEIRNYQSNAYRWPIEVLIAFFASIYFCAGYAKLVPISNGWNWLSGVPIQWLVSTRFFDSPTYWILGKPMFDYTILWPFTLLSISAIIVELSAGLIWFTRKAYIPCLLIILSLHLGIYLLAGMPGFFQTYFIFCFVFIPTRFFSRYD